MLYLLHSHLFRLSYHTATETYKLLRLHMPLKKKIDTAVELLDI